MPVTNHKDMIDDLKARREVLMKVYDISKEQADNTENLVKKLDDLIERLTREFQPVNQ